MCFPVDSYGLSQNIFCGIQIYFLQCLKDCLLLLQYTFLFPPFYFLYFILSALDYSFIRGFSFLCWFKGTTIFIYAIVDVSGQPNISKKGQTPVSYRVCPYCTSWKFPAAPSESIMNQMHSLKAQETRHFTPDINQKKTRYRVYSSSVLSLFYFFFCLS